MTIELIPSRKKGAVYFQITIGSTVRYVIIDQSLLAKQTGDLHAFVLAESKEFFD